MSNLHSSHSDPTIPIPDRDPDATNYIRVLSNFENEIDDRSFVSLFSISSCCIFAFRFLPLPIWQCLQPRLEAVKFSYKVTANCPATVSFSRQSRLLTCRYATCGQDITNEPAQDALDSDWSSHPAGINEEKSKARQQLEWIGLPY